MDRRQKKTRSAIFSAFTSLLAKKSYDRISVTDIIEKANVGRTTFYAHFETKDYLLKELLVELFDHINPPQLAKIDPNYTDPHSPLDVFLHLISHIGSNDKYIADLFASENNAIFTGYFKENIKSLVKLKFPAISSTGDIPEDYAENFIASSFVETVTWWLSRGKIESPETVVEYFYKVTDRFLS